MTVKLKGFNSGEATGGTGGAIVVGSEPGDILVLIMASQSATTKARPPAGWEYRLTEGVGGRRSGYVATTTVTDPSVGHDIHWWSTDPADTSRQRACVLVISGASKVGLADWKPACDPVDGLSVVAGAQHDSAGFEPAAWPHQARAGRIVTGQSWSVIDVALTATRPDVTTHQPSAWVVLPVTDKDSPGPGPGPNPPEPPQPGPVPDGVTLINQADIGSLASMPAGAPTVDALLATRGFTVAHRGGSASWPEHSMRAYTQSVARACPALEASFQRTSDGVWVACHDLSLNTVDPTAPTTPIRDLTWEQVRHHTTKGEPLMRAEELIAVYGPTHVLVIDPKSGADKFEELTALGLDPARTIMKFSIDATWLAARYKAAGYKCWGYAYQPNLASVAGYQAAWDYLGMEWDASKETWDTMLSYGKPVWGHVCPTKAAVQAALDKGAVGCMVSAVADVLPLRV